MQVHVNVHHKYTTRAMQNNSIQFYFMYGGITMNDEIKTTTETTEEQTTTETALTETIAGRAHVTNVANPFAITGGASKPAYTSMDVTTPQGKKKLYHITNHPDYNISDFINKTISIVDIYVDVNPRLNKDTDSGNFGTYEDKPRTVLIDTDGKSYVAGVSIGIFNAVREILRIFGDPNTWPEPLDVMPVLVRTPKGNMLSLEIV